MKHFKLGTAAALLAFAALFLLVPGVFGTQAQPTAVDPAATTTLKRMTDYLGSLERFSVQTQNTLEDLLVSGHRIDIDVSAEVLISRPNRIRSERKGDLVDQIFFYDGTTLTLYNPSYDVYAKESVPDTFEGLFKFMYESLGFGIPVSDLDYSDSYPLLMQDVTFATVIGTSFINGVKCDHLLFSRPGVDFQVWVAQGDKPLPYKYVVTDTVTPERLSITTIMSNWDVSPNTSDAQFTFVPPSEAMEIDFIKF